ncbi:DgyrCDS5397 [Dimorphilus gyrociliatus]|uniref:DgyrCDS5397 n=1 Tax=Dimorphilus gyrociliatus TaxID=2664684 RepID=A0A7I8VJS6_9ANNE|nr:DgyrCDS5397 [Dimorphilus gyrociliatus]
MAAFIAKQMVGDQLKSVKGAMGDGDEEKKEGDGEEDPEVAEARREAEEKRKEKHRKMEEEREEMRQQIRDKYGLKKKEIVKEEEPDVAGRLGRKKKSPAELAAENDSENEEGSNISSRFIFVIFSITIS